MNDFNPRDPASFWNRSSLSIRGDIVGKARVRQDPKLRLGEFLTVGWKALPPSLREFLLSGMYDGINCDHCGAYIPDVPDSVERLVVGYQDQTFCSRCGGDPSINVRA